MKRPTAVVAPTLFLMIAVLTGCASQSTNVSSQVSKRIEERTGTGLNPSVKSGFALPDGVSLTDGLSEDEAIAIALWNNGAFQTDLSALGFARADLIEAGLLRNPIFTLLFPLGPKQLEATANLPIEVFWQRPRRVAAAKLDMERIGESLVQTGLNLVRDVRLAYADLRLARDRARIASTSVRERTEVAQIFQARVRAGDISELDASASRVDARLAQEQAERFGAEAAVARDRLRFLLGMEMADEILDLAQPQQSADPLRLPSVLAAGVVSPEMAGKEAEHLVKQALASRPDLRAAELAIEAAGKRAKWERSKILSVALILDANAEGKSGFEAGPGIQAEFPILNRNRGGITRAEAEIERAARQYAATRQRIVQDVRESYTQLLQARRALDSWRGDLLPSIEEEIRRTERAYAAGEVPYYFILDSRRRLIDFRLREADESAALARAAAQLERAVGRKLSETP